MKTATIDARLHPSLKNRLTYRVLQADHQLVPWADAWKNKRRPDFLFVAPHDKNLLELIARRRGGYDWGQLYLVTNGQTECWRPQVPCHRWHRAHLPFRDGRTFVPSRWDPFWESVFRLDRVEDWDTVRAYDPGSWKMPLGDEWAPHTWVTVEHLKKLPEPLLRFVRITNTDAAPRQVDAYLTRADFYRDVSKDYLTGIEAIERCPSNKSFHTCIGGWPLKYVPVKYLVWLLGDGQIDRDPLPLTRREMAAVEAAHLLTCFYPDNPEVRVRYEEKWAKYLEVKRRYGQKPRVMNLYGPLANMIWLYLKEHYGSWRMINGKKVLEVEGFTRPTEGDPFADCRSVWRYRDVQMEVDTDWATESREFCTWGYWSGRNVQVPILGVAVDEHGQPTEGRTVIGWKWVSEHVPSGTSQKIAWQAHGTPQWLDTGFGGGRRWNRLRAAREEDYDPAVCELGEVHRDRNGRRYVHDWRYPQNDAELGVCREIVWDWVPENLKNLWARGQIEFLPWYMERVTRQCDWRPSELPRDDLEAWRMANHLLQRAESIRRKWEDGRRLPAETMRIADEEARTRDKEEDLDFLDVIERQLHAQACCYLDGIKDGEGIVAAVEQEVAAARQFIQEDAFHRTTAEQSLTEYQQKRFEWQLLRLLKVRHPYGYPDPISWAYATGTEPPPEYRAEWEQYKQRAEEADCRKREGRQEAVAYALRYANRVARRQASSEEEIVLRRHPQYAGVPA